MENNNKNTDKKIAKNASSLSRGVIEYAGSALGLFLLRNGKDDLAYKVITKSKDLGRNAEHGIDKAVRKTSNVFTGVKEDLMDKSQDKTAKSAAQRVVEMGKTFKDTIVEETKSVTSTLTDKDKIKDELKNIKNTVTSKAKDIESSDRVQELEQKVKNTFSSEAIKDKIAEIVKNRLEKKGYDFSKVNIDHTNDPFYDNTFVPEDTEAATKATFTHEPPVEINLEPEKEEGKNL